MRMSEKDWFRPKVLEISLAPRSRTTSKKTGEDHDDGVELGQPGDHDGGEAPAAHDGGGEGVVGAEPASSRPIRPQTAPESTMVRTMTRSTLMPA